MDNSRCQFCIFFVDFVKSVKKSAIVWMPECADIGPINYNQLCPKQPTEM